MAVEKRKVPRCLICRRQLPRETAKKSMTCIPKCPGPPLKGPDYTEAEIQDRKKRKKVAS